MSTDESQIQRERRQFRMCDFGRDHWSLLAYIETCCVDSAHGGIGTIDKRRVRCNEERHPLSAINASMGVKWQPSYGTRLAGYFLEGDQRDPSRQIPDHDDWDCMDDLEAAGLIEVISEAIGSVRLTDHGIQVSGLLRAWKARGGHYYQFRYDVPAGRTV